MADVAAAGRAFSTLRKARRKVALPLFARREVECRRTLALLEERGEASGGGCSEVSRTLLRQTPWRKRRRGQYCLDSNLGPQISTVSRGAVSQPDAFQFSFRSKQGGEGSSDQNCRGPLSQSVNPVILLAGQIS